MPDKAPRGEDKRPKEGPLLQLLAVCPAPTQEAQGGQGPQLLEASHPKGSLWNQELCVYSWDTYVHTHLCRYHQGPLA